MNENLNEVTTAEVKKMFKAVLWYSRIHGYLKQNSNSFEFFGPDEWVVYCNENNEQKCPDEWVGDTDNTDPSIIVAPIGTVIDEQNQQAVAWGVFRNAGVNRAADFLVSITSFRIPQRRRAQVAKLAKQIALDN